MTNNTRTNEVSGRIGSIDKIIVFDGVCVLCNHWVRFVLRHDVESQFAFAAMQSASGRALLEQQGMSPDDPASFLLVDEGMAFTDSTAIIRMLGYFRWHWRLVSVILSLLPRRLLDASYRYTARNRYRWFGKFATCSVPTPATRHRFLP